MKIIIALLLAVPLSAPAQDSRGRQRQPPPSGGTPPRENPPRENPPRENPRETPRENPRETPRENPRGTPRETPRENPGETPRGGGGGGASRRTPPADRSVPPAERPGRGAADTVRGRGGEPQQPPQAPAGAVRRDSLPPRHESTVIGELGDPRRRHGDERERGRYYWHEYQGRRYSHYVDPYGDDWFFWYYDGGSYSMRYYDGRWWRYDPRYGRTCYLRNGYWYYEDGSRNYVYDDETSSYEDSEPVVAPDVSVSLSLGSFSPAGRGPNDVITKNAGFLNFDEKELNSFFIGGEVSKGVGNNLEVGVDAGYYKGTANSSYIDYVHPDGTEARQQLSLTAIPVTATAKVFPFGRDKVVQPYVGGGLGVTRWKYQEKGEFIDFAAPGLPFYNETYSASGYSASPVLIAGLRVPLNNRVMIGGEYRRSWGQGILPPEAGFAGDKIALGGNSFRANVTINIGHK